MHQELESQIDFQSSLGSSLSSTPSPSPEFPSRGTVHVWNTSTRAEVSSHYDQRNGLAWSPDGKHIASAGTDDECAAASMSFEVWKAKTGSNSVKYSAKDDTSKIVFTGASTIQWSPDGSLISAEDDWI